MSSWWSFRVRSAVSMESPAMPGVQRREGMRQKVDISIRGGGGQTRRLRSLLFAGLLDMWLQVQSSKQPRPHTLNPPCLHLSSALAAMAQGPVWCDEKKTRVWVGDFGVCWLGLEALFSHLHAVWPQGHSGHTELSHFEPQIPCPLNGDFLTNLWRLLWILNDKDSTCPFDWNSPPGY